MGVDVHAHDEAMSYEHEISTCHACELIQYGTPLDELFRFWHEGGQPFDADEDALGWLQILESEGYNIEAYLEKERDLHTARKGLTLGFEGRLGLSYPRQLIFELQTGPSLSLDWWIDPQSSMACAREEFKNMIMHHVPYDFWEGSWPFSFPKWMNNFKRWGNNADEHVRLQRCVQSRADRRLERKAAKARRARRQTGISKMPGSWL